MFVISLVVAGSPADGFISFDAAVILHLCGRCVYGAPAWLTCAGVSFTFFKIAAY